MLYNPVTNLALIYNMRSGTLIMVCFQKTPNNQTFQKRFFNIIKVKYIVSTYLAENNKFFKPNF
jgi:hypothetical protein